MTLREAILAYLPCDSWRDADSVMRAVSKADLPQEQRWPRQVTDELDAMTRDGLLAHTLSHSVSIYRRRTEREIAEREAVRSGKQPELL